jgi:hypothetical protein
LQRFKINFYFQSSTKPNCGRFVKIIDFSGCEKLHIQLSDLQLSAQSSLCLFSHTKFLVVADTKTIYLFHKTTGEMWQTINFFSLINSSFTKSENCCHTTNGLREIYFAENRLLIVQNIDRTFPFVANIFNFW